MRTVALALLALAGSLALASAIDVNDTSNKPNIVM